MQLTHTTAVVAVQVDDVDWFDSCSVCGNAYHFGDSRSEVCAICALAPDIDDDEAEDTAGPVWMTPAATLRCAARYLSRHGWTQGAFYACTGRRSDVLTPPACMGGAVAVVCFGVPVEVPGYDCDLPGGDSYRAVIDYLDDYLITGYGCGTFAFNDVPGRTVAQVMAALLAAADVWDTTFGGAA